MIITLLDIMVAAKNENELKNLLENKFGLAPLTGIKFAHEKYKVESTITFQLPHNDLIYLFEVDSYNTPKVLFGEYVLLNNYLTDYSRYMFIAIQYAKAFNTDRTANHLNFARKKLGCKIPFKVFDGLSIMALALQSNSLNIFFKKLHQEKLQYKLEKKFSSEHL